MRSIDLRRPHGCTDDVIIACDHDIIPSRDRFHPHGNHKLQPRSDQLNIDAMKSIPFRFVLAVFLAGRSAVAVAVSHQRVLGVDIPGPVSIGAKGVRKRLKDAEIIPTVIDDFVPSMFLEARWSSVQAALGNTLEPKKLEQAPSVLLSGHSHHQKQFVVTLTDPDAPSRKNPKWSEFCHWIATGSDPTSGNSGGGGGGGAVSPTFRLTDLTDVMPYKPPGPPENTGKHRYVFLVLEPRNGTTEKLHLSKPSDRQHWGYDTEDGETRGVREWAKENGLVPVAANFIYAKHQG